MHAFIKCMHLSPSLSFFLFLFAISEATIENFVALMATVGMIGYWSLPMLTNGDQYSSSYRAIEVLRSFQTHDCATNGNK